MLATRWLSQILSNSVREFTVGFTAIRSLDLGLKHETLIGMASNSDGNGF
jgi:hypothetical protein